MNKFLAWCTTLLLLEHCADNITLAASMLSLFTVNNLNIRNTGARLCLHSLQCLHFSYTFFSSARHSRGEGEGKSRPVER